jgi:hypothetical protein
MTAPSSIDPAHFLSEQLRFTALGWCSAPVGDG